jgi:hypothetical protein
MVLIEDAIILFVKGSYAHEEYTPSIADLGKGENPGHGQVGGCVRAARKV